MSDSLGDSRNLEVHLEDVFGRLEQLKYQRRDGVSQIDAARSLLELSEQLRETSQRIRSKSEGIRRDFSPSLN